MTTIPSSTGPFARLKYGAETLTDTSRARSENKGKRTPQSVMPITARNRKLFTRNEASRDRNDSMARSDFK